MKLISWNVNGLRSALAKGLIDWLAATTPDILCLQEVRAMPAQLGGEPWRALGYRAAWHAAERAGYSGVLTLTRTAPLAARVGLGVPEFDAEGRLLVADYPGFTLLNAYVPSGQRDRGRVEFKLRFYAALLALVDELHAMGRSVILCGDLNTAHHAIDLARPRANQHTSGFLPEERAWLDTYLAHGLVDAFRALHPDEPGHYTWWSTVTNARARNVGWRLDYFLVSAGLMGAVGAAEILPQVAGSDHCPVVLELELADQ